MAVTEAAKGFVGFKVVMPCFPRGLRVWVLQPCDTGAEASPATHWGRPWVPRPESLWVLGGWLRRDGIHMQWSPETSCFSGKYTC